MNRDDWDYLNNLKPGSEIQILVNAKYVSVTDGGFVLNIETRIDEHANGDAASIATDAVAIMQNRALMDDGWKPLTHRENDRLTAENVRLREQVADQAEQLNRLSDPPIEDVAKLLVIAYLRDDVGEGQWDDAVEEVLAWITAPWSIIAGGWKLLAAQVPDLAVRDIRKAVLEEAADRLDAKYTERVMACKTKLDYDLTDAYGYAIDDLHQMTAGEAK